MPSDEWTDGAFPIRRARIVAARLDTYRPSSPTASTWLRTSETRSPPTWCAALRSARAITCSLTARSQLKIVMLVRNTNRCNPNREDPSFFAVGRALGLRHQTVQRCVERAVAEGPMAALDDRPRPGREPTITLEAKAWLVSLACRKAKDPPATDRRRAMHASPIWRRAPCAKSSTRNVQDPRLENAGGHGGTILSTTRDCITPVAI
jgi:hypothetical protein